ncbi:uncharacterized protein BJ171DRAFT_424951 [Polychytrium aggregatum]|uniref:uncharacterized protein n=1 Tax=Polychytrium aggregatum TaxID=110093 RepID=UPI0022FE3B21|nr:uncharacterized protein BJ171DRAFT_424951 [Polychytrium aggregatum]KAI9203904.1 hypothetical protein BJ171DRAFT_424951 [Polychytrium aggregatum]
MLRRCNQQIHDFVVDPDGFLSIPLAPMPAAMRTLVARMAKHYGIGVKARGSGQRKLTILCRNRSSRVPENWKTIADRVIEQSGGIMTGNVQTFGGKGGKGKGVRSKKDSVHTKAAQRRSGGGGGADDSTKPAAGTVVGQDAAPVGGIGEKMLLAMGWRHGQSLGTTGEGITQPVQAVVRAKFAGLGT